VIDASEIIAVEAISGKKEGDLSGYSPLALQKVCHEASSKTFGM
jgi:hypothetical protein